MLPTNPTQEIYKDARLYAAVPYRAFKDRRLGKNEFAVLIAACGFVESGRQSGQVPQQWIADQMGVHHTLIHRHIIRLEAFGYLVRLAPKSKRDGLAILYGVAYDENDKPTLRKEARKGIVQNNEADIEQLPKKEAIIQYDGIGAVKYPSAQLLIVWRGLVFDYYPNELELKHWAELATLGATPEHLAAWHQPGRDLIGYYMHQARASLK